AGAGEGQPARRKRALTRPRRGHVDLSGVLKYDRTDARDMLERASARETAARTAAGAVCRRFLREFDIRIASHVIHLGGIDAKLPSPCPTVSTLPPMHPPYARSPPERQRHLTAAT